MDALKMVRADQFFIRKEKQVETALKNNDYLELFIHVDKKVLIPVYIELFNEIPDKQKYDVFIDLYIRSEFGFEMLTKDFLSKIFTFRKFSLRWKKRISKLKNKVDSIVTVYRGQGSKSTMDGISWTLERKTAEFFAKRFGQNGRILKKEVNVDEILDYLENRGESEVFLLT